MENNLPRGWLEIELHEVVANTVYPIGDGDHGQIKPSMYKDKGVPYIRVSDMGWGIFKPDNLVFIDEKTHNKNLKSELKPGDVLIAKTGATIGKCCIVPDEIIKANTTSSVGKVTLDKRIMHPKWLLNYFLSREFRDFMWSISERTAQPGFNIRDMIKFVIPLPPRAEHDRIIAKLDALRQKIEANKLRLEKIPKLLKRFRQSVLAAAVNGELTEDWRVKNGIIDEWKFKRAEDTCQLITKGTTPTNNGLKITGEIPYLKVYNIVEQKVDFNYKPQFVSKEIHNGLLKRSRVYPGDVLLNIVGPPLGKVAIVPNEYEEWNINQAIAFFRAKELILPDFIFIILCEGSPISEIEKEFRGTAGQSNISLQQCRNFLFPVPEIEEQKEILRKVHQFFAFADRIEARYIKANAMIDKLPQSILAKAFRGELVSQDSNDEPASVLLERLKAAKAKLRVEKSTRKGKARSN